MPPKVRRMALCLLAAVGVTAGSYAAAAPAAPSGSHVTAGSHPHFRLRAIKHVWLIVMENEDYKNTFADKQGLPYLAGTLEKKGLLLTNYYGTGHESLDNYISLTSGQAPNTSTQADCQNYTEFPGNRYVATPGEPNQQSGSGCVYPPAVNDIGSQLSAKHVSWKGYMEDMGNNPARDHGAACGHPVVGTSDGTQKAVKGDGYATRHDPFMYFHKIIDKKAFCRRHVVAMGTPNGAMPKAARKGEHGLAYDLKKASRTPAYSFVTPNLCNDGHDYPCQNGQKSYGSAVADINHWAKVWIPKIMASPAYRHGGLIEITFDESGGPQSDSTACCGEGFNPNAIGGMSGITGPGGGKIGALLLSPLLKGGHVSKKDFNHYSTLATDEAIFGLKRLGYATKAATFAGVLRSFAR